MSESNGSDNETSEDSDVESKKTTEDEEEETTDVESLDAEKKIKPEEIKEPVVDLQSVESGDSIALEKLENSHPEVMEVTAEMEPGPETGELLPSQDQAQVQTQQEILSKSEGEQEVETEIKAEPDLKSIKPDEIYEPPSSTSKVSREPNIELDDEISLTADIGDSDEVMAEPFLELDTETLGHKAEIEAEEQRLAEEAAKAAEEKEELETGIFAIKTSIGHEKMVANWLAIRVRKRKLDVYAILSPPKLRGYLLLEGVKNKEAMQDMIKGVQHARSVVDGASSIEEIEHFLTPKPLVSGIEEGDVVEIIAGPFKGEKAKVTQIDEAKEEITVELFEAMVSIPVTIRGDHVRILEKEGK